MDNGRSSLSAPREGSPEGRTVSTIDATPHFNTLTKGGAYSHWQSDNGRKPMPFAFAEKIDNSISATKVRPQICLRDDGFPLQFCASDRNDRCTLVQVCMRMSHRFCSRSLQSARCQNFCRNHAGCRSKRHQPWRDCRRLPCAACFCQLHSVLSIFSITCRCIVSSRPPACWKHHVIAPHYFGFRNI